MKALIIVIAVVFIILILIIGSFTCKFFQMAFKQIKNSNAKRIEMSKEHERMKQEFEDRHNKLR